MLSSESSKYFKRGIALSGVMTRAWSMCTRQQQKQKLDKLLSKLGCPKNSSPAETKKFLKSLSVDELYKFYPVGISGKTVFHYANCYEIKKHICLTFNNITPQIDICVHLTQAEVCARNLPGPDQPRLKMP